MATKDRGKKFKQISVRVDGEQYGRLEAVADHISRNARGQRPEISEILRSLIGFGNAQLLTAREKDFLSGKISSLEERKLSRAE